MLTKQTILEILDKPGLQAGINDYSYLLNNLYSTNVAEDAHYQDVFRKFYQMRKFYSDEFASGYFQLLEELKAGQITSLFRRYLIGYWGYRIPLKCLFRVKCYICCSRRIRFGIVWLRRSILDFAYRHQDIKTVKVHVCRDTICTKRGFTNIYILMKDR